MPTEVPVTLEPQLLCSTGRTERKIHRAPTLFWPDSDLGGLCVAAAAAHVVIVVFRAEKQRAHQNTLLIQLQDPEGSNTALHNALLVQGCTYSNICGQSATNLLMEGMGDEPKSVLLLRQRVSVIFGLVSHVLVRHWHKKKKKNPH